MGIELIIDTSMNDMVVGIASNGELVYKLQKRALHSQSEIAIKEVDIALKECKVDPKKIERVIVTIGPGSYTGVRIALTIAKVYCSILKLELVPLTTLQALAGTKGKKIAIIDARSNMVYYAKFANGERIDKEQIVTKEQMLEIVKKNKDFEVVGDLHLLGMEDSQEDLVENMFNWSKVTKGVRDIDRVNPLYLKG